MCEKCGCSETNQVIVTNLQNGRHTHLGEERAARPGHDFHSHGDAGHSHSHSHDGEHDHDHRHEDEQAHRRRIQTGHDLLQKNNRLAERNRGWFAGRNIVALNLMSSPGAGKTTLLERTLGDLQPQFAFSVIEGDQATLNDAERIRKTGCAVVQINTGAACHLDAGMIEAALHQLQPSLNSILFIENVGNLVCPALFDLGEASRVVVSSVTEGDDKPQKYPHMFRSADAIVLNKMDLLPHIDFDAQAFEQRARELNPSVRILKVSASRGTGMNEWYDWVREVRDFTVSNE